MIQLTQNEKDCFRCCVGSILEDKNAPDFCKEEDNWWELLLKYLAPKNLTALACEDISCPPNGYYIASDWNHSVVCYRGEIVWDPHPDCIGLEDIKMYIFIIPIYPEKWDATRKNAKTNKIRTRL